VPGSEAQACRSPPWVARQAQRQLTADRNELPLQSLLSPPDTMQAGTLASVSSMVSLQNTSRPASRSACNSHDSMCPVSSPLLLHMSWACRPACGPQNILASAHRSSAAAPCTAAFRPWTCCRSMRYLCSVAVGALSCTLAAGQQCRQLAPERVPCAIHTAACWQLQPLYRLHRDQRRCKLHPCLIYISQ
jgi:hypothetical protein